MIIREYDDSVPGPGYLPRSRFSLGERTGGSNLHARCRASAAMDGDRLLSRCTIRRGGRGLWKPSDLHERRPELVSRQNRRRIGATKALDWSHHVQRWATSGCRGKLQPYFCLDQRRPVVASDRAGQGLVRNRWNDGWLTPCGGRLQWRNSSLGGLWRQLESLASTGKAMAWHSRFGRGYTFHSSCGRRSGIC